MRNFLIYLFAFSLAGSMSSCRDDDPSSNSIFDTTDVQGSVFDQWLKSNYTYPYNIEFKYKMEDIESDMKYELAPARIDKSVAMSRLIKFLWLEAYDEAAGVDFTRSFVPKIIHLIGSGAYNTNNTVLLGTAEGGLKITLYKINDLNIDHVNVAELNASYLKTMHHEFAHILHQTKNYTTDFKDITGTDYIGNDWSSNSMTLEIARAKGFVSRYARYAADEDFVEIISIFLTNDEATWNAILDSAGDVGADLINRKFTIAKDYLKLSWSIDIYQLRSIIANRSANVNKLDLKNF